jgi:septal ring factor EnvC (AmiA/AmiB activator)
LRFARIVGSIALLFAAPGFSQDQQQQLEDLRQNIARLQSELAGFEKTESATLEYLRTLDKEIDLTSRLVGQLRKQEQAKREAVKKMASGLQTTETELTRLQDLAAQRAVFFYKYGRIPDLEMLLTSRSLNQVLLWAQYQSRMAESERRLIAGLNTKQQQIREQKAKLEPELEAQQRLLAEKLRQDQTLKARKKERQDVLKRVRKDKAYYQAQLAEKKQAAEAIAKLITADIAIKPITPAPKSAQPARGAAPANYDGSFAKLKGRMLWPVLGKVVTPYGDFRHPILNTVTKNLGVDIAAASGSEVRSVANGRVMTITWQRGYGNVVIVLHADGFYTVYTHLAEILVAPNENVSAGQALGRIGEESGEQQTVLHFQIWQRTKENRSQDLNPQEWLQ